MTILMKQIKSLDYIAPQGHFQNVDRENGNDLK